MLAIQIFHIEFPITECNYIKVSVLLEHRKSNQNTTHNIKTGASAYGNLT